MKKQASRATKKAAPKKAAPKKAAAKKAAAKKATAKKTTARKAPANKAAKAEAGWETDSPLDWRGFTEDEKEWIEGLPEPAETRSASARRRGHVVVLPGILGSPIGAARDLVWLDPSEIPRGGLRKLRLPEGDALTAREFRRGAFGILYSNYRTTCRYLSAMGYEVHLYPYDWRRDVARLGSELADWLARKFAGDEVALVAHSMGGLVCRAAFGPLAGRARVTHLITAGTPLRGSASPFLAMRQLHSTALSMAKFDLCQNAGDLANVFATFPGLLGMLPGFRDARWFRLEEWPRDGFHPPALTQAVLEEGRQGMAAMQAPPPGCAYYAILGDGCRTISAIDQEGPGRVVFRVDLQGDGTVPEASGKPEDCDGLFYVPAVPLRGLIGGDRNSTEADHGSLLKRRRVAEAIHALLERGACDLPKAAASGDEGFTISEAALREQEGRLRSSAVRARTPEENRDAWLQVLRQCPLLSPPGGEEALQQWEFPFTRSRLVRGSEVEFEIELAQGDIVEADSRVILLGQHRGTDPSTAALSVDEAMGGALLRILGIADGIGGAGDLRVVPTGRHPLSAEVVAFLSLGHRDLFSGSALALAVESATRTLLASHFDEFATTLMGGRQDSGTAVPIEFALRNTLRGLVGALREDPERKRFRRLVIVERDPSRLREMHQALCLILHEREFEGCAVTLSATVFPQRVRSTPARRPGESAKARSHQLIIRMEPVGEDGQKFRQSLAFLPASGSGAAVRESSAGLIGLHEIESFYEVLGVAGPRPQGVQNPRQLEAVTARMNEFLDAGYLGAEDRPTSHLPTDGAAPLEIIHNADASRLPWEALSHPSGSHPALTVGLSRRFTSERARVLWPKPSPDTPRILMVIDPTGDLVGAREEGAKLRSEIDIEHGGFAEVDYLVGPEATKERVVELLETHRYDLLHYAGHSAFSRQTTTHSGLILHGYEYFTGADALRLTHFPGIVFFNSCEAARIRRLDPVVEDLPEKSANRILLRDNAHAPTSVAEAFLTTGVRHFVGTFWVVDDRAAHDFAIEFYRQLLRDQAGIGAAVRAARRVLHGSGQADWANYIHYGDPADVPFPKPNPAHAESSY